MLVVNAGSSSVKLSLLGACDETLAQSELHVPGATIDAGKLHRAIAGGLRRADAVGHRIVHGGDRFREAVRVDRDVLGALAELADLAPLHQAKSIAALHAVSAALPALPAVACFDTAFHAEMPEAAATYALPRAWRERWALRRYGFHGLSHAWVTRRVAQLLGTEAAALRIVSCHLGAGASLCAIADGRSQDTTMGFTPLEGLAMATRSGTVDAGLVLWLLRRAGLTEAELAHALEHESGMLGLCGTADMREVLSRAGEGDQQAILARSVYLHRLRSGIAAMTASIGGLDALAFTGGVGERSAEVRAQAAAGLGYLGVEIDPERNGADAGDREITAAGADVRVLVVRAREDLEIAGQVRAVLGAR